MSKSDSDGEDSPPRPLAKRKRVKWSQAYMKEWEAEPELSGWLTKSKRTEGKAFCIVCCCDLSYHNGGVADLKKHAGRDVHKANVRSRELHGDLRKVKAGPKQRDAMSVACSNAVLQLGFFLAENHLAIATADRLTPLIAAMCSDSKIAAGMKAARTKMTAVVHTIAEDMHSNLLQILRRSYFSIMPDESADVSVQEQVAVAVRVFNSDEGCVRTYSLGLRPVDQANAESIFGVISSMLEDGGLSWDNVIGYCSDGANVMRGSRNSVMTRILARQPHAYTLHCVCHVAQLCAQAACDALLPDNFRHWLHRVV
eukprot:scpid25582/ scgid21532/ Zinc finger MYM-type protein 6; Zinc finger protein 258